MTNFPTYQHRYLTPIKRFSDPAHGQPAHYIQADANLHYLNGNKRPYFSVTGTIGPVRNGQVDGDAPGSSGGCVHDEVLKHFPELAPVVALHLCDDLGSPGYNGANGWYCLGGYYQTDERYHFGNAKGNYPLPEDRRDPAKPWMTTEYREPTPDECLQAFADHVRLSLESARDLADGWRCADDWSASRRWYQEWFSTQAERFKAEADAAIVLLDRLITARDSARTVTLLNA